MSNLLELQNLHVSYRTPRGTVQAVRGVDLTLQPGEVLAIVGESGCGKSALCKAIMRLLPDNADIEGRILVNGTDIAPYPEKELQKLRGRLFSMVFQDPMTALNPSMTIGAQIAEAVLVHEPKISRDALRARVLELMELVGIDRPNARMKLYPHNFSGGMRQRAVLAIALASRAKILLADEPTHGAGRDHSGADSGPSAQASAKASHRDDSRLARSGRGGARGRPCRRDVRGKNCGNRHRRRGSITTRATHTPGHFCARFRRSVRLAARSTPSPACRRR